MQGNSANGTRKRASTPSYVSPNQLILEGFESPFDQKLSKDNRWVKLSKVIAWDNIVSCYDKLFTSNEGRPPISGRVVLGCVIIKHLLDLTDRETIEQVRENMFMQYFLGYSSFTNEAPFSASLFVEIRERLNLDILSRINEIIVLHNIRNDERMNESSKDKDEPPPGKEQSIEPLEKEQEQETAVPQARPKPKGKLLMDATVAPQNITFPTDLKLLDAARIKSEELIDKLYKSSLHGHTKVRTYRQIARKAFLNTAKKKQKSNKEIYKSNGQQLRYLKRNLGHIDTLLAAYTTFPLTAKEQKYLMVLHTVYEQQEQMHRTHTNRIEHRIVNIHQPHVRPIVRGKENAKVEFGSKLQVSLVEGYTFIDHHSWEAFNEGGYLMTSVEKYKQRFGYYPAEVQADQIYCTRENRSKLKELGIKLIAKPLGRPSATAVKNHISPGERNPIEGKFGQGKIKYGLDNIKAKLSTTSISWIAAIALVLNLVRLTRQALLSLMFCQLYKGYYEILKQFRRNYKMVIL
jgi:hypothetical protein